MNIGKFCIEAQNASGASAGMFTDLVSVVMTRERYTPYVTLDFTFDITNCGAINIEDMVSVRLVYELSGIFFGRTAGVSIQKSGTKRLVTGRAVSYTKTVSTCDAVPGMIFNCSLNDIVNQNTTMPNVTYQQVSDTASYIYVKESDTIWLAITALSIKLYEQYPYIKGMNTVNINKTGCATHNYSTSRIVSTIHGNNFSNALSRINMKGTQDTYEYYCNDSEAIRRGIMRERYIPLDRQWLNSPQTGLKHKLYFARRGGVYRGFTYYGFKNEQLCDTVIYSHGSVSYTGEVSKLILKADKKGIFTTVISYDDGYASIMHNS